ncbi:MAG TPA: hypothetical protein VNU84_03740 [Candidatus Acidoferrum sp.]|nr:hypothetical protein [Candidatus Acidoferrum sp.]
MVHDVPLRALAVNNFLFEASPGKAFLSVAGAKLAVGNRMNEGAARLAHVTPCIFSLSAVTYAGMFKGRRFAP